MGVAPGSRAEELYGPETPTNSLHHQAVGRIGDGVVVTGTTDDGVVEAFEVDGRPEVFAVQWHPEMLSDQTDPAFLWLVRESAADDAATESEFRKELRECAPERRRALLADHIASLASAVIGFSADQALDPNAGFFQLGMDSLMSVTLQRRLAASLGLALPAALIYEYPTVSSLTDALYDRMGFVPAEQSAAPARPSLGARAAQRARARREAAAGKEKGHQV